MNTERKRYDLTSADTKIIGTDYQFFYFINELLKLKKGQQLGYEVKLYIYEYVNLITSVQKEGPYTMGCHLMKLWKPMKEKKLF